MKLARQDLYRIILEEYLKEEGFTESKAALDLLRRIKGDPDYDPRKDPGAPSYDPDFKGGDDETVADEPVPADETYPMDKPMRAKMSQDEVVAAISGLIQGKGADEVSEIFELVFGKIPGVEIGEPEEELPPSPYSGKAIAQRQAQQGQRTGFEESFALGELMELIKEVLSEEHSGEESYDEWIDTLLHRLTDHYRMEIDHEAELPASVDYKKAHAEGACPHATADQVAKEY